MDTQDSSRAAGRDEAGFSLIELLVVVGLIAVMAAVALPNLMGYLRLSKIRGATQEVSSEIATARAKAIQRNTNFGVSFWVTGEQTYRYAIEEPIDPAKSPDNQNYVHRLDLSGIPATAAELGPVRSLPLGVVFVATGANDVGARFTRLGAMCDPVEDSNCGPALPAGNKYVVHNAQGMTVTLSQPSTKLTWRVRVTKGGRVLTVRE